jgi:hypothetical protein
MAERRWASYPEKEPPAAAVELAAQVEHDGGHTLALYQDPVGEHWQNIEGFDVSKVRYEDVQRSAIMAIPAAE